MIKTILVPATGEDGDLAIYAAALAVARSFGAHLDVLHVQLDPVEVAVAMTSDVAAGTLLQGSIDRLDEDTKARAAKTEEVFNAFCQREGVAITSRPLAGADQPSAQFHIETGEDPRWAVAYAMGADLVVAGRGSADDATGRTTLETVLLESGRPLLIPAAAPASAGLADTVAIAWKPVAPAARAVALAAPFLARAKDVIVLTVAEDEADHGDDAERLVRNLEWRGVSARAARPKPDGRSAAETLLDAAHQQAGLLVMGGYGHGQLREWVFGGFTQQVLANAPLPVLIAH